MVIINRSLAIELQHITSAGLDLTPPTVERVMHFLEITGKLLNEGRKLSAQGCVFS